MAMQEELMARWNSKDAEKEREHSPAVVVSTLHVRGSSGHGDPADAAQSRGVLYEALQDAGS